MVLINFHISSEFQLSYDNQICMNEVKVLRLVYIHVHVCNVQKGCVIGIQTVLYNVHVHVHVHTCISNIFTAQEWC